MSKANRTVALQTRDSVRQVWFTVGEYRENSKACKTAYLSIKDQYSPLDIRIIPVREGRNNELISYVSVTGEVVRYPMPSDKQVRALRDERARLNGPNSTVQERVAADGISALLKLAEFVRAEAFIAQIRG